MADARTSRALKLLPLLLAVVAGLPAIAARWTPFDPGLTTATILYALGIAAGAFVVSWGVDLLRIDLGGGLALAILALVTVAPEYSVEAVYAWKAGADPSHYAPLALANMTGSNRLLIGLGWPVVVVFAWLRKRREPPERRDRHPTAVLLSKQRSAEIAFLGVASLYTITLPLRTHLTLGDALILGALYVLYIARIHGLGGEDPELVGPAEVIAAFAPWLRRVVVGAILAYAALLLIVCAEPFAEGVVGLGRQLGLDRFFAVRWLAPLASESPELILAVLLGWRLQAPTALAALISTKLNQWTLLIGSIPILFCLAHGGLAGLPIDRVQREALLITAAQSLLALSLLVDRELSLKDAAILLVLFLADLLSSMLVADSARSLARLSLGGLYLVLACGTLIWRRATVLRVARTGLIERLEPQ